MRYIRVTLITLFCGFFWQGCTKPFQDNPEIGLIQNFAGEVKYFPMWDPSRVKHHDSDKHMVLTINDIGKRPLYSLDRLVIATDSFLHIHFYNHGDVYLGDSKTETILIIKKPEDGDGFQILANLTKGIMNCFIEKKDSRFAVRTPIAVAGVLGTQFRLEVQDSQTVVTVIESSKGVEIENAQEPDLKTYSLQQLEQIAIPHLLRRVNQNEPDSPPSWDSLQPQKIESIDYQYPIGKNDQGKLNYQKYFEYPGSDRTKILPRN